MGGMRTDGALQPDGIAQPKVPYSQVFVSDDLVFVSGQIAFDEDRQLVADDIEGQCHRVFENLRRCLTAAGCGFDDVVKVTAFLTDLGNFAAFNAVYEQYFRPPFPARSTVGVQLVPGILVEVELIARRPAAA
jgi:2-iminobutanoate/2-iminopropanoate deaminase